MRRSAVQSDTSDIPSKQQQSGVQAVQIVLAADTADPGCGMCKQRDIRTCAAFIINC